MLIIKHQSDIFNFLSAYKKQKLFLMNKIHIL
jgi:hypothetical protein